MQRAPKYIISVFLFVFFLSCTCDDDLSPMEQLPPETMTGENTFGCLVDGEFFEPEGYALSGPDLAAEYQWIPRRGYVFRISAGNQDDNTAVNIVGDSLMINGPGTFSFVWSNIEGHPGSMSAFYLNGATPVEKHYYPTYDNSGEVTFTRFDNSVVSGTFWFDGVNELGDTVRVRKGRFDVKF